ncbi:ATP-binding protein [Hymenobacter seoulensis]
MDSTFPSSDALPDSLAAAHAEILALRTALAEQRMLARIPEQNPNPIYRLGPARKRLYANPAAELLASELSEEELEAGRDLCFGWAMNGLVSGQESKYELQVGSRYFSACVVPFPEEQYVNLYLVEITERVMAQQRQAAQQAFVQQVLDALPILVYVRDEQGTYVFRNRATIQLSNRLLNETPSPETAAIQAAQLASYDATDAQVLATGKEVYVEEPLMLPDGEPRWLQTIKQPLAWDGGETHVLGVSTDITELKQATENATVAARARENFLANMSHEIRTPLNGVLGMANQLNKTNLSERQRELLGIIRSSGQHLLGVINDVLDMAKISSGKLELAREAFNLCDSISQALQPLALQAQEKGIEFVGTPLRNSCPYPWVVGDPHRLNQILLNLVSNAVKFTPANGHISVGGYLLAETASTLTVEFRVTDTGVGIAPDKVTRIFENFTQAYADTARHFGGTGLGLSISRALVEQMGGKLTVSSTLGQGSTFAFQLTLPRTVELTPLEQEPAYDTGALRGRRILLVEDNEINRVVARMLLEEWGIELDEAPDGTAGLACFESQTYDAVLMDIQMPGMSGMAVTTAIRHHPDPRRASVPILALTANAFQADTERYLACGMNDCVAKPFQEQDLYAKLLNVLAPAPYDLTSLHNLSHGKSTFVYSIIRSFLTNMPASLELLRAATRSENWPEVARLVHHIKPSLLALGIAPAAPLLVQLEQLTRQHPDEQEAAQVKGASMALRLVIERVLRALPAELAASEAS